MPPPGGACRSRANQLIAFSYPASMRRTIRRAAQVMNRAASRPRSAAGRSAGPR